MMSDTRSAHHKKKKDSQVSYQMSEVTETGLDIIALTSISPSFGRTERFFLTVLTRYFQYDSLLVRVTKHTYLFKI